MSKPPRLPRLATVKICEFSDANRQTAVTINSNYLYLVGHGVVVRQRTAEDCQEVVSRKPCLPCERASDCCRPSALHERISICYSTAGGGQV